MNVLDLCLEVVSRSCQPLRYIRRWISRKPLEIEAWFQRTTNRIWHIGYQMVDVTWPPKVLWGSTVEYPSDSLASCWHTCGFVLVRPKTNNRICKAPVCRNFRGSKTVDNHVHFAAFKCPIHSEIQARRGSIRVCGENRQLLQTKSDASYHQHNSMVTVGCPIISW